MSTVRPEPNLRVVFARVPILLHQRIKNRAKKCKMQMNDIAILALERWCETEEEAEMNINQAKEKPNDPK